MAYNGLNYGTDCVCYECGKKFWIADAEQYAYKRLKKGSNNIIRFCSYHCMKEYDKKHTKRYNTVK